MIFKSKVDRWLKALVFGIPIVVLAVPVTMAARNGKPQPIIPALLVVIIIIAFNSWLFRTTDYRIENGTLHIRSAFIHWTVEIREIVSIVPTRNPLSSPALSLDRLQISYRKNGRARVILVSPEDKRGFIDALRAVNGAIPL